jgi:hypothetical protein
MLLHSQLQCFCFWLSAVFCLTVTSIDTPIALMIKGYGNIHPTHPGDKRAGAGDITQKPSEQQEGAACEGLRAACSSPLCSCSLSRAPFPCSLRTAYCTVLCVHCACALCRDRANDGRHTGGARPTPRSATQRAKKGLGLAGLGQSRPFPLTPAATPHTPLLHTTPTPSCCNLLLLLRRRRIAAEFLVSSTQLASRSTPAEKNP